MINFVKGTFTGNWRAAWNGVKQIFSSVWNSFKGIASRALGPIATIVSNLVSKVQNLISKIGKAKSGAGDIHVSGGTIPKNATGTKFWRGGWTYVNEKGGEIMNLPRGTQIIPHDVSMEIARSAGAANSGSRSVSIAKIADTIVVREDADIDKIAQAIVEKLEDVEGDVVHAA